MKYQSGISTLSEMPTLIADEDSHEAFALIDASPYEDAEEKLSAKHEFEMWADTKNAQVRRATIDQMRRMPISEDPVERNPLPILHAGTCNPLPEERVFLKGIFTPIFSLAANQEEAFLRAAAIQAFVLRGVSERSFKRYGIYVRQEFCEHGPESECQISLFDIYRLEPEEREE